MPRVKRRLHLNANHAIADIDGQIVGHALSGGKRSPAAEQEISADEMLRRTSKLKFMADLPDGAGVLWNPWRHRERECALIEQETELARHAATSRRRTAAMSSNVRSSPASTPASPVASCQRCTATSQ